MTLFFYINRLPKTLSLSLLSSHFSAQVQQRTQIPFSLLFSLLYFYDTFMARLGSFVIILLVLFASSVVPSLEARKLLNREESDKKVPSLFESLVLSALPKGNVPPSSPSKKTHATLNNEQLFVRHLAGIDRILRSVPSPGIGH